MLQLLCEGLRNRVDQGTVLYDKQFIVICERQV